METKDRKQAQADFLASLEIDPSVSLACDKAHISRDTAYRWKKGNEAFSHAWDTAVERCRDIARGSIYQRGIIGWNEPLVSMGQPVYEIEPMLDDEGNPMVDSKGRPMTKRGTLLTIHKWSDSLAALYAKANLPEYKDKPQVNINAQLADLAEQAKQELLANLESAIASENRKSPQD